MISLRNEHDLVTNIACLVWLDKKVFGCRADFMTTVLKILETYWSINRCPVSYRTLQASNLATTWKVSHTFVVSVDLLSLTKYSLSLSLKWWEPWRQVSSWFRTKCVTYHLKESLWVRDMCVCCFRWPCVPDRMLLMISQSVKVDASCYVVTSTFVVLEDLVSLT